jgi:elongation factor P--(R)-beta-lysine ligase
MADEKKILVLHNAARRAHIIDQTRNFFRSRNVLEVDTPVLSQGISTDCHIDIFSTEFFPSGYGLHGSGKIYYLQTSPEFHMKRLLAEGYPDIFQICKVFRNGERGRSHNPEFTILEWYRKNFTMHGLIDEIAELCQMIAGKVQVLKMSYRDIFIGCEAPDPLEVPDKDLFAFCQSFDPHSPNFSSRSDALNYIMSNFVEPRVPHECMVFIHNFPSEQAILAEVDPQDPRTAQRFELYYKGYELCNGYTELTDWKETEKRLSDENERRKMIGKPVLPVDKHFIQALQKGLPPCSGVALGLDRLVLIALGYTDIDDVLMFPWELA